jgi:hypothetical protein
VGVLVDRTSKLWQRFRIVISSMARKRAAANLYHKPLQTREPRGNRSTLRDYRGVTADALLRDADFPSKWISKHCAVRGD